MYRIAMFSVTMMLTMTVITCEACHKSPQVVYTYNTIQYNLGI